MFSEREKELVGGLVMGATLGFLGLAECFDKDGKRHLLIVGLGEMHPETRTKEVIPLGEVPPWMVGEDDETYERMELTPPDKDHEYWPGTAKQIAIENMAKLASGEVDPQVALNGLAHALKRAEVMGKTVDRGSVEMVLQAAAKGMKERGN